jgi:hypothetical protein
VSVARSKKCSTSKSTEKKRGTIAHCISRRFFPRGPSKAHLISGTQRRALLRRREVDIGNVAQGLERFIGAGEVRGPKQDIEIGELAQGKIAVRSFLQRWALIGDRIDGMRFKAIENANQFADENEIAACIVLVARTQFIPNRGRNPFCAIAKRKYKSGVTP